VGIALQTFTIAVLLHQRRMVSLASLDYREMGRCLLAALAGGSATGLLAWGLGRLARHPQAVAELHHAHSHVRSLADAFILITGVAVWTLVTGWTLEKSGSALPRVVLRRLGIV
jgi:putative peptidoglycan lipid II flippase